LLVELGPAGERRAHARPGADDRPPPEAPPPAAPAPAPAPASGPWLFFSPAEEAVRAALAAAGRPLAGKQIAARVGTRYDSPLKYLLMNLEERRVITHTPKEGYRLAEPEGKPGTRLPFVPTEFQRDVMTALAGKALRSNALAREVGCEKPRLYQDPGGVPELQEQGWVGHHKRLGYFSTQQPPPELAAEQFSPRC
jgi:hypothetical protein